MNKTIRVLTAALVVVSFSACGPKKVKEAPPTDNGGSRSTTTETSGTDTGGKYCPGDLDKVPCLRQRTVYFDYDKSDVKSEAAATLQCHAKYLRDNPTARMTLEGHADERGTREYNLGLGERRGNAASGAIGQSGQTTVVSYGEERPTCTESNEGCWSKNRRVEIIYTAK